MRPVVHCLWVRGELTELAKMSLASYYRHADPVLWSYDDIPIARDARGILPEEDIEKYSFHDSRLAHFSDVFGWHVIRKFGGWWGHMDMTLNRPLDIKEQLVLGPHRNGGCTISIWKAPKDCPLLTSCIERVWERPTLWNYNMDVMSLEMDNAGLRGHIMGDLVNDSMADEQMLCNLFMPNYLNPWPDYYALHWWASGRIRNLKPKPYSYYDYLRKDLLGY